MDARPSSAPPPTPAPSSEERSAEGRPNVPFRAVSPGPRGGGRRQDHSRLKRDTRCGKRRSPPCRHDNSLFAPQQTGELATHPGVPPPPEDILSGGPFSLKNRFNKLMLRTDNPLVNPPPPVSPWASYTHRQKRIGIWVIFVCVLTMAPERLRLPIGRAGARQN